MFTKHPFWFASAALLALAGCSDEIAPTAARLTAASWIQTAALQEPVAEFQSVPRFDLDLKVHGSLRPGVPIQLVVSGRAHFATADADIQLMLPDVVMAERGNWKEMILSEPGDSLPPHGHWRRPLAQGEQFREQVTLTIPEPGYYGVVASVIQRSDDANTRGELVSRYARKELWLWIDEHGGRITDHFDPSLFPPGVNTEPGPRGAIKRRKGDGVRIQCTTPGHCPSNSVQSVGVEYMDLAGVLQRLRN